MATKERISVIVESFKKTYIQYPIELVQNKSVILYDDGKSLAYAKGLPLYIHLKACVIVSQEMLS